MAELVETLTGTVVSQQANFFYVRAGEQEYACFLRGKLKKSGETPVVGDHVIITLEPVSAEEKLPPPREGSLALPEPSGEPVVRRGFLDELQPRKNLLKRPSIANVDQILLVFAAAQPPFNPLLLDKFLVTTAYNGFAPLIVLNKRDLVSGSELDAWVSAYRALGYTVIPTEATPAGVRDLLPHLAHKTSVLAGPSGVGKSSLVNALAPGLELRTLDVSAKLQRGRHTTRHAALYPLPGIPGALLADTPGFSFLEIEAIAPPELGWYFPEMVPHIPDCKFPSCLHQHEPQCAVRDHAEMSEMRYDSYVRFLDELLALEKVNAERTSKVESGMKARGGRTGQEERLVKVDAADREANRRAMKQQLANFDFEEDELDDDEE
ncbi:MAG TPA: ribosome small subunit-dependent GTPase A [Oscillatoriaceae cyanobacterium]